jgi:hypothetical protein
MVMDSKLKEADHRLPILELDFSFAQTVLSCWLTFRVLTLIDYSGTGRTD